MTDLVLSGVQHRMLARHLLPADGKEAAAILLCRDLDPVRDRLMVIDIALVPYEECGERARDFIAWPGSYLSAAIDRAEDEGLTIVLTHSHPGGLFDFSAVDDDSDILTIGNIFAGWSGSPPRAGHGSAIMIGSGRMRARLYSPAMVARDIDRLIVVGDDIATWSPDATPADAMAFGRDMTGMLSGLHACVIGVSGTGSLITEQAARMGFGELTLIDFDRVEAKNLNRIINSTTADAESGALKTEVLGRALPTFRPGLKLWTVSASIMTREAVLAAARADVIFSCVDSAEGRQIADLIAQAFMIPLIDMGVTIPTRRRRDGGLAIADVVGRIDYVQPHGTTLADREVFTPDMLRAEYLRRVDEQAFEAERREGYIRGAPDEAASVIALNMRAASAAMLEYVARLMPFRHEPNRAWARTRFQLGDGEEERFSEDTLGAASSGNTGRGLSEPLLGIPDLGQ